MTEPQLISETEWIAAIRGNGEIRDRAIVRLRNYLVRGLSRSLSHRYGGSVPVEDVAQEAILKILDSIDSFQGKSKFTTWAMSIAIRTGISKLRRHYYRDVSLSELSEGSEFRIQFEMPGSQVDNAESKVRVLSLLDRFIDEVLSDRQRQAIRGMLEGLPIEEIAVRLHSNRNAIYKLAHDARLRLREAFERSGIEAQDIVKLTS